MDERNNSSFSAEEEQRMKNVAAARAKERAERERLREQKKEKRNHQVETQDSYICVDLDIQEFNSPDKQHLVNIHSVPKTEMNEA